MAGGVTNRVRTATSRIALVYLLFGVSFIAVTEVLLASNESDQLRIALRLLFVATSGALLLFLVRRELVGRQEMEDRLIQAQHSQSLARLAGGVAHDFNNLLTVILGYTDIVLDDLGPDHPSAGDLGAVRRSGEQARLLVDQLLTLSRQRVAQPDPIDPTAAIASLREVLLRLLGPDVELDILPFEVPNVLVDRSQLDQVLLNLVINARDALPEGGRVIIATANGRLPNGRRSVDLRVTDNGVGMDPSVAAQCFEPFFTTKARSEGTGLGLATVAAVVAQAGGEVSVDSAPGRGTTFLVQLPAELDAADGPPAAVIDVRGGRERVLVVEDDDHVRHFTRRVLTDGGYQVTEAPSGAAALVLVRAGEVPDLVITDVLMPVMGGVELAERLREVAPQVPVLFISGYAEDPGLQRMAGEVPFLPKPFTPPDLLGAVRRALEPASDTGSAQGSNR